MFAVCARAHVFFEVAAQSEIKNLAARSAQDAYTAYMSDAARARAWFHPHEQHIITGIGMHAAPALPHGNPVETAAHEKAPGSKDGVNGQDQSYAQK